MTHRDPAARAERERLVQPLGLPQPGLFVRVPLHRGVALDCRSKRRVTDRHAGDLRSGGQISFKLRRLHAERIGIGVEAVCLRIRRQHCCGVDFDPQQVTNGVGVFRYD